jgi:glycosyltransferase involved in cell wall biosynthesis
MNILKITTLKNDMKKLLFVSSDMSGCYWYRSYLPSKYLSNHFITSVEQGFNPDNVYKYLDNDIIVLQRHNEPNILKFIDIAHSLGKQVWFDIDDLLWNLPASNCARFYWKNNTIKDMSRLIERCDAVTTSTIPIAQYLKRFNKNVHVFANMVEPHLKDKIINDKLRILYAGSSTHKADFDSSVIHSIKHIIAKYDIEFYFVGFMPDEFNNPIYSDKVRFVEGVPVEKYTGTLQALNPDIAIMPLADNMFNSAKSNLKFLENTLAGAVSIGSDIYPYRESIISGSDGFICKNKAKIWIDTFERLIEDERLRNDVYKNAVNTVSTKYMWNSKNIEQVAKRYVDIYEKRRA